jgi:hypothetical protein
MKYYFLAASLPPLKLGEVPDISFEELVERFRVNLSKEDLEKTVVIRRAIDLANIRALLLEEPIDPRGNLNQTELDEALLVHAGLPDYVFDFLDRHQTVAERLRYFSELMMLYYREEIPRAEGFLQDYLTFERNWRLVMIAVRAKAMGRDVVKELQFEDLHSPLVLQILAQRDAPKYEPPPEFVDIVQSIMNAPADPWQQYVTFAEWRFKKIEEFVEKDFASINWIIAYMVRLLMVEYANELDEKKGNRILDTFKLG